MSGVVTVTSGNPGNIEVKENRARGEEVIPGHLPEQDRMH